jgi:hypothetical protein
MNLIYLDEFGHIGPYYGRYGAKYNESPVFGLAGIILPEEAVRPFATYFLKRKMELLAADILASRKPPYKWEKKGTNLFTVRSIGKYPEIKRTAFRLINEIRKIGGRIFYYGREKLRNRDDLNSNGLYRTVLSTAIRQLDAYSQEIGRNFVLVVDEHSARKELLECAAKTMFGNQPARWLSSPPFEVESYLNQNVQAADWIATIIGRMWAYNLEQGEFADCKPYRDFFWDRVAQVSTHSSVMRRPQNNRPPVNDALAAAMEKAGVKKEIAS